MHTPSFFRRAVEAHDLDQLMATFADDAVLHSPITFQPFEGKAAIRRLLSIIVTVLQDFQYTDELTGDGSAALIFRARIGKREVEGLDLLGFDAAGQVRELTVMIRPRSGLEALLAAVGPRLAAALSETAS